MSRLKFNLFLFSVIILSFIPAISALDFNVNATIINNRIEINEIAEFKLAIKNMINQVQTLRINNMDYPTWDINTKPIENPILITLEPFEEKELILNVKALDKKNIRVGPHFVKTKITSRTTNEAMTQPLNVIITSRESLIGGYVPTIITNILAPAEIDPREEFNYQVSLNNQNAIDYSELKVVIEGNLIFEEILTPLGPREDKIIELKKIFDPLTSPQEDSISVTVFYEDRLISKVTTKYRITEYNVRDESPVIEKFLKSEKEYSILSNNENYDGEIKVEAEFLKFLFSSTEPEAKILKDDDKRYFLWDVKLDENKSMTVKVIYNYRAFTFSILAIILVIIGYYVFRKPIVVSKRFSEVKKRDGGIDRMKVIINIRNRSSQKIENMEIKEMIPNIVEVEDEVSIGTLKPSKVMKNEKGEYLINWYMESLDSGEERVLSYNVKSKLPVIGGFTLNPTKAKYKVNEKYKISNSNRLEVVS